MLVQLFTMVCFKCKSTDKGKPEITLKKNGTMVTVHQHCARCGQDAFVWQSQPLVHGKFPAGNMILSFAILMSGVPISKTLLLFRHIRMCVYTARAYYKQQKNFIFPLVVYYWETYRNELMRQLKDMKDVIWAGDARFDSMGHSAKYGVYTMLSTTIMKIVHFEIVQVMF